MGKPGNAPRHRPAQEFPDGRRKLARGPEHLQPLLRPEDGSSLPVAHHYQSLRLQHHGPALKLAIFFEQLLDRSSTFGERFCTGLERVIHRCVHKHFHRMPKTGMRTT